MIGARFMVYIDSLMADYPSPREPGVGERWHMAVEVLITGGESVPYDFSVEQVGPDNLALTVAESRAFVALYGADIREAVDIYTRSE